MSNLSDGLDRIAEAIRYINPYVNPTVKIQNPRVGLKVGTCMNCGNSVKLRQPWLSEMPVVNDGWYVLHCENEECHNCYGMELKDNEFSLADFVVWDDEHLIKNQESEYTYGSNVIPFRKVM